MKKLFQRQKGGHKPADGSPAPSPVPTPAATPRSMVPAEPSPAEEHWVMLAPSNGATPATQLPPGAGHDPAVARGGYDHASVNSHTEHSSPPSQAATPAGGKLQKKGGFFSRHTDQHGKDVSHASGPPQSQPPRTSETHHRDHSRRHEEGPTGAPGELTRMIGYLTGFAADDWTVVLEVCERAAASEANAREAAKALRREFKYAEPGAQMAAARLWAIMLRYSSEIFIAQTTTKKFLEVVEEVCTSSKTTPVVRERLLEVIAGAAFAHPVPERSGFAGSWRRIKAPGQPDEGIPFDDLDPMFTPPAPKAQRQPYLQHNQHPSYDRNPFPQPDTVRQRTHAPPTGGGGTAAQQYAAQFGHHAPQNTQGYGNYQAANGGRREREVRVPSAEEEIRNLYNQCELARNNARLLSEALVYAKPIELASNPVIKEFHTKCMGSQDFIVAQIPWATANSDRSREKLQEQQAIAASIQGEDGQQQQASETAEEQLLALLLQANQDLVEVFKQYDELERLGAHEQEENEVALRSLQETRLDRTQIQYYSADGSFQLEAPGGGVGAGGSGSRSPSPSPLASAHSTGVHSTRQAPQLSHQGSNVSYGSHQGSHPSLPQIATQPPTPAALGQNGPQIHQLPPTPVDLLGSGIVRDPAQQQQYNQYAQQRGQPQQPVPHPNQQQYPQQYPQHPQQHGVMAPPPPAPMGPRRPRSRTPSPTRKERADRERERGSTGGGSERDSSSEENNAARYGVSPSQLSAGYPAVPSQKALGKRRAPEPLQQPEQNDLLRTVGVYGDSTTTLDNIQDDSEDESPAAVAARAARPKWMRQPVSFVYDAAEERRKEREHLQQQAKSSPAVPTVNGIGGSGGSRASAILPAPVQIDPRPTPVVAPVLTQTSPIAVTGPQTPTPTLQRTGTGMSGRILSPAAASPDKERVHTSMRTRTNSKTLPRGPTATVTVVSNRTGQ